MSTNRFTSLLATFFLLVINLPMNIKLVELIRADQGLDLGFILSLPVFFIAVFFIVFWFFSFPMFTKCMSITIVVISTLVSYSMYSYGVVFDYSMIQNVFETNYGEASAYLNSSVIGWVAAMGVIPSLVIMRAQIVYKPWRKELLHKSFGMLGAVGVILVIAALYFKDYSAFGRNNSYLSKMIVPTEYLASTAKYINRNILTEPPVFKQLGTDARVGARASTKPQLMVLVLGETARSMNYQLNGYPRETNPFTSDLKIESTLVSFQSVMPCGTATAVSVPCMFSRMSHDNYDGKVVKYQDSLIDIFQHAGFNTLWLDNDGGCKGICERVDTWNYTANTDSPYCINEFCYDQILVDEFDTAVERVKGANAVIGLHLNGSHGPTYFERYPQEFRHFLPDCQRSDIQNCSNAEIVNTYDNTIRYTDYVLSEVIKKAQALSDEWDVSVVYVSDHGESLGENGIYLHGMPYALAPKEQTQVPMILWVSDDLANSQSLDKACLEQRANQGRYSHDNLFDTLLGMMSVNTSVYRAELDILAGCRG